MQSTRKKPRARENARERELFSEKGNIIISNNDSIYMTVRKDKEQLRNVFSKKINECDDRSVVAAHANGDG